MVCINCHQIPCQCEHQTTQPESWEKTVLTDTEKIAITDGICKKYKLMWEDIVDGKLSSRDLEQFIIDVYDKVAKAQAKPTWETAYKAGYEKAAREAIEYEKNSIPANRQAYLKKGRQEVIDFVNDNSKNPIDMGVTFRFIWQNKVREWLE